jgi:hypothetical protein
LETKVQPVIIKFLNERGLELSLEKTKITHIIEGFNFLGFNITDLPGFSKKVINVTYWRAFLCVCFFYEFYVATKNYY